MGNKLSCSCGPLKIKGYRFDSNAEPWSQQSTALNRRRPDGNLLSIPICRLWAEVFHVTTSSSGTVKWTQVSEDLVPVNITCLQDSPEIIFHITAYNSQVEKILDVKLTQPGTRIGQASECFVYWKDTVTNDTWGLNFTSPIDAKQFRECCDGSRLQSRFHRSTSKHSSRSTPASPSKSREPQCTCMTAEQFAKLRSQNDLRIRAATPCGMTSGSGLSSKRKQASQSTPSSPTRSRKVACTCMTPEQFAHLHRYQPSYTATGSGKGSQTLPREGTKGGGGGHSSDDILRADPHVHSDDATYNNNTLKRPGSRAREGYGSVRERESGDGGRVPPEREAPISNTSIQRRPNGKMPGTQPPQQQSVQASSAGSSLRNRQRIPSKSIDYSTGRSYDRSGNRSASSAGNVSGNNTANRRARSKSTDQLHHPDKQMDSGTLKKMLKPVTAPDSPVTSPEGAGRRRGNLKVNGGPNAGVPHKYDSDRDTGFLSEPECGAARLKAVAAAGGSMGGAGSKMSGGRGFNPPPRGGVSFDAPKGVPPPPSGHHHHRELFLDFDTDRGGANSPPSDSGGIFDSHCFATTPSSSNGNSDIEGPASPTSQLLMDYEEHLRNTLEKGLDAESYSLQTFEALLSRSMENLEHDLHGLGQGFNPQTTYLKRKVLFSVDRDRSRTMPSRIETRSVAGSYAAGPRSLSTGNGNRYFNDRPRSVNSNFESGPHPHGLGPTSISVDQSGYVSDKTDLGYQHQYVRRASGSSGMVNRIDRLRVNPQQPPPVRMNGMPGKNGNRQDSIRSGYMSDHETKGGAVVHQQISVDSVQSQDSRLCYLTSSEISDDDRMSLTTAISDEEDIESNRASPYKIKSGGSAASFNCTGAVRKAGFLSVKKWLLRKKHQVELARKRGWKGYWVCLKGTTLLFYPCDSQEGRSVEATPKHLIIVDGAIMQAIPEHPKRDFIFCLSTAFGDAYLFQAPCQVELENWVNSIHSACAASFARHRGKTGTLHLLQEEIYRIEKAIESDQKLKHMAELQLSVVSDPSSKIQIEGQIRQWEENLERLHCEQFRLRCYMASLQNGELPNPKGVLTQVTPATKVVLNRLGVFTVSSFHAYVCARSPSLLSNLLAGRGATKRRAPPNLSRSNSAASRRSLTNVMTNSNGRMSPDNDLVERAVKVILPDNQMASLFLRDAMTVEEFLTAACQKKGLNPVENFVRVKKRREMSSAKYFVPHRSDLIETYLQTHEVVEVCAKILYQVELRRGNLDTMWGFSVEAELVENSEKQDELCCYVSRVEERSVAMNSGIIKGDEMMVINGAIVSDLDMMFIESVLQEELSLCMMMRSARTDPPELSNSMKSSTDDMIDSLVCPPPPSDNIMNEDIISSLIVPAPGYKKEAHSPDGDSTTAPPSQSSEQSDGVRRRKQPNGGPISMIDKAMADSMRAGSLGSASGNGTGVIIGSQPALDVDALLRRTHSEDTRRAPSPTESLESANSHQMTPSRAMSDADKMRKVILELVETEQTYVENLARLMKTYFEPLSDSIFFSNTDISSLFGNIQEIFRFQQQFLRTLEEAIEAETQFNVLDSSKQFKNVLFSIGSAFLYYVNHFKLYSSFCASHSKAQKALHPTNKSDENQALQEFLQSCNRRQQHSTTLESYLIQPIQRILKYPLLLQQLKSLAAANSDEQQHLVEALIGMERVAEHINEMQRIHEEYGAIFDHLFRQHQKTSKQLIDLSPGDLLYYGGVEWLNISDFLGKIKKGLELHAMCFVFKTAVVFLCKERLRHKKKSIIGPAKQHTAEVEIIRYQVLIPVTEVQVRASSVKDVDSHYLWELIHLKNQLQRRNEKIYHLSNSTAEFRNAFLKTIRQIIRESVRNMSLPGPESFRKLDNTTPPYSARSGSIDMQLQKPKLPEDSVELDIHSETDSAREFSSGLKSDGDEAGGGGKHSYHGHNSTIDLGGHIRHFQSGGKSSKTASQPHLPHANASSAYNSADSDLGKAGKCFECHFSGQGMMQQQQQQPPQPPSRRIPPQNNNNSVNNNNNNNNNTTGNGESNVDRSRLHVGGGSRCSAQSSIDTDQGSVSTTGRESTTAADEEEELEGEEEGEEEEDFEGSVEVPAPSLPPPPPLPITTASDLGSPVWKPRDDTSVGGDHPNSSTSSTPAGADQMFGGQS